MVLDQIYGKINPYDSFLECEGALSTSKVILESLLKTIDQGKTQPPQMYTNFPMILPLFYQYELDSRDYIQRMLSSIDASICKWKALKLDAITRIGKNIIIHAFPLHIKDIFSLEKDISIKCYIPPEMSNTESCHIKENIRVFQNNNTSLSIEYINTLTVDFIRWADAIVIDTYAISRGSSEGVSWISPYAADLLALNNFYFQKPVYLIYSYFQEWQSKYSIFNPEFNGQPVSLNCYKDLITENGFANLSSNSW